ncbi:hypothetical protein AL058_11100 [Pseudomonas savastanoi pv. nerii]|nr:hypothetical protein AL058_11100 [Pseudomonas savastanoi pv. nerii]
MILAIQPEETVRSFVARTLLIKGKNSSEDVFRKFPRNSLFGADILMHRNFKMPMHQADAMKEASCLHSDA